MRGKMGQSLLGDFLERIHTPKDTVEGSPTTEVRKEGAWP